MPDIRILNPKQVGPTSSQGTLRPVLNDSDRIREALLSEDSYTTTLLAIAMDSFPPGEKDKQSPIFDWHPETIKLELEQEYGIRLPKLSLDKIMAGVMIRTNDLFFREPYHFIELANVLSGDDFEPDEFEPADSVECAWAITEALLLCPPDDEDPEPFSDDVRRYLGFVLKEEGFVTPPGILRIALDADLSAHMADFADDPELAEGIFQAQQSKAAEVETIMREQLAELTDQLERLPLRQGTTADLAARLRRALQSQ